jgi:hypothetical protein
MESLNELFYKVILLNELSGNVSYALKFSDPDGVRSGKSGWSFGVCQYDTQNNANALLCLYECGFTKEEVTGIVHQNIDVKALEYKLKNHVDIIQKWDTLQLTYCLNKALNFDTDYGIPVQSPDGILAGADYVNQYGSQGNGARDYYKKLGRPITAKDVLEFKLNNTRYGKVHPKDCERRYNNIIKVLTEEGVMA